MPCLTIRLIRTLRSPVLTPLPNPNPLPNRAIPAIPHNHVNRRSLMGNIVFQIRNSDASVPTSTLEKQLSLASIIDIIAAIGIGIVVGLKMDDVGILQTVVGCLIVAGSLVDSFLLYKKSGLAVPCNALLVVLTFLRDILCIHDNDSATIKIVLIVVYSLLVVNKACVLVVAMRYQARRKEEAKNGLTHGLLTDSFV